MRKKRERHSTDEIPQMPFDDALRKLLSAPPQHRPAKKKKGKKK
jgi:hypothetical protein